MDYSLLKNKVYLTLLAYYDGYKMPSFIRLGEVLGVTRQTASTKVKELMSQDLVSINEEGIVAVRNELNIDVEKLRGYLDAEKVFNPVKLRELLFTMSPYITKKDIAKELKIAKGTMYLDDHSVVYGIYSEGKLKYIGTTQHFDNRVAAHIKKRPFLTPANFIILADHTCQDGYNIELQLIHLLRPEWNVMGKDF